jgi:hypothetical protein
MIEDTVKIVNEAIKDKISVYNNGTRDVVAYVAF